MVQWPQEVSDMEENRQETEYGEPLPAERYTPRPAWQVWAARIGLVIMILAVAIYYLQIAGGGR